MPHICPGLPLIAPDCPGLPGIDKIKEILFSYTALCSQNEDTSPSIKMSMHRSTVANKLSYFRLDLCCSDLRRMKIFVHLLRSPCTQQCSFANDKLRKGVKKLSLFTFLNSSFLSRPCNLLCFGWMNRFTIYIQPQEKNKD